MKKYQEYEVPTHIDRHWISTVCDLCGDESETGWAPHYSAFEATVRLRDGIAYPECGNGTEIEYDLCPTCFREKLIPWLESQGAKTVITEWDW
jgi:hypothetical protein